MTPSASGSRLAGKLGLTDRIFAGPRSRRLWPPSRPASSEVDRVLARELRVTDALADATSRYLYEAGGKRVRPMLALLTAQLGDGATDERHRRRHRARDDPPRLALPRRRDGCRRQAPRCAQRARRLGQQRRDPHRRPAVLAREPDHGAPRRPRDPPAGRHVRAARARPDARDRRAAGRRGPRRVLPPGARRQDRLAHRGRRAGGHHLLQRTRGVRAAAGRRSARRSGSPSSCSTT